MKLARLIPGFLAVVGLVFSAACGEEDTETPDEMGSNQNTNTNSNGNSNGNSNANDNANSNSNMGPQQFVLVIENISGDSALPGPFAPGTLAVHSGNSPLFVAGAPDAGDGLEGLAEDGGGVALATAVGGEAFGVPVGATDPGPLVPGGRYEVTFDAPTVGETLSFATMLVQSNDLFITNGVTGIPLFDSAGEPLAERDITDLVELWDAGTEVNQAPGYGPDQPLQSGGVPNVGAPEGGISVFNHPTRALPNASQLMEVTVVDNGADFTVTVRNATGDASAGMPIAPVFYAAHSDEWSLFTVGEAASAGLEILAEDGSPMTLVDEHTDAAGTVQVGAQAVVVDGTDPGPSSPGQSYEFTINPTAAAPYVTFAAMAVATNDVFIAPPAEGIRFIDEAGARRAVAEIEADIRAQLDVWDAGTEINQVPGVGPDQPMNGGEDIGAADPIVGVRRYRDSTNDLDGADNFVNITVAESGGEFTIEFSNISDGTAYPAMLTPIGWALHDANTSLFTPGEQASVGIERIAEDGDASELNTALASVSGVDQNGIEGAAPIMSGETYTLVVTPTVNGRFLSFATMVVPSNDAFIGNSTGVALLDETGTPRPALMVVNELLSAIQIYDAGTEANEVGAVGGNQAPRGTPNTGPAEGDGTVRPYDDPIWGIPSLDALVRVTVRPIN